MNDSTQHGSPQHEPHYRTGRPPSRPQRAAPPTPPATARRRITPGFAASHLFTPEDRRLDSKHRRNVRLARTIAIVVLLLGSCCWMLARCACTPAAKSRPRVSPASAAAAAAARSIKIGSFLGGDRRDYYGNSPAPRRLDLIWRAKIGAGWTRRKSNNKPILWSGTGWTGQCTVVETGGKTWLVIGGYDHNLRKIDAATGKVAWKYAFDDVIKSTNTVFVNPNPSNPADRLVVVAGSRRGSKYTVGDSRIAPLRAISFATGRELWRLPFPKTDNYSQDMDSSCLLIDNTLYAAIEPGYVLGIDPSSTRPWGKYRQPVVRYRSPRLYTMADAKSHPDVGGANVAIEASPARLGNTLYIAAGSGHVYGLRLPGLKAVWDFRTRTDIDGTTVVTRNGRLLQSIERQYVKGPGGVFMLDPSKPPRLSPVWYFPTLNRGISEWAGGVIGSVGVNDSSMMRAELPRLAAFISVDGYVYVVSQDEFSRRKVTGPDGRSKYRSPVEVYRDYIGGGISTPIIVGDTMLAAGFDRRLHAYRISYEPDGEGAKGLLLHSRDGGGWRVRVRPVTSFGADGPFESTPVVWNGRVYIGCRDGYLYCLGEHGR